ncbi:TetR/AcrR family transcriptional regulator [Microbacterium atlanticum]|uniref:TetR/AcrR family transcriptional regulator n=1 Tax=Microbacterium atlanticum TaxID=2782168 RepID=UPI001887A107|nr:TetR/AcrR family transcriptional regulator [Microbacterium atlanticum]
MTEANPESATRERTRRAILDAAIATLTKRPAASLGDIADAAGVARSTLHRYYGDRTTLEAAIHEYVKAEHLAAVERARPADGTGIEAFARLASELLDQLHVFAWWMYADNYQGGLEVDPESRPEQIVARGHADGSIDAAMPADWVVSMLWSALYSIEMPTPPAEGTPPRSPRESRELALRTLLKLVEPG